MLVARIACDMIHQALHEAGVGNHGGLLPAVALLGTVLRLTQQNDDAPLASTVPERQVAGVTVSVPRRGIEILDDQHSLPVFGNQVRGVSPGARLGRIHLLTHAVRAVRNTLDLAGCADWDSSVHLVDEDPEERVAKLVSSVGVKQPREDIG